MRSPTSSPRRPARQPLWWSRESRGSAKPRCGSRPSTRPLSAGSTCCPHVRTGRNPSMVTRRWPICCPEWTRRCSTSFPGPQRVALDGFRLRAEPDEQAVDQRAIGAAFLTVVETLAETAPVLIAIDDLQWVDVSSEHAIAFAARRLKARVGVLGTARAERAAAPPRPGCRCQSPTESAESTCSR